MATKKLTKGLYNWTILAIVIVAIVLINIISSIVYYRVDVTKDQRYSLAPGTEKFLSTSENFKSRLNLKIYLEGNLPADLDYFRDAIEDKLKEFKLHAGDRIEYQFIDPNTGTDEEKIELYDQLFAKGKGIIPFDLSYSKDGQSHSIKIWPGAIIDYGGSTVNVVQFLPGAKSDEPVPLNAISNTIRNSTNNLEYMLVSSIRRATQETKPRIAFIQGHGELEYKETQRIRALLSPYFSLSDLTMNDSIHALDSFDGAIIARPRKTFSDKDLYIIDQFLLRGGRLMCFMDKLFLPEDTLMLKGETHSVRYANGSLGLDKMLFDYGLKLQDNYVLDVNCAPKIVPFEDVKVLPWFFHVFATPTAHPISRNLDPVSLKYTGEIQFVNNNPNIALTPILTTSSNATSTGLAPLVNLRFPINYGRNPELVPNPENELNKKCIAGLAEGMFESHFKSRISPEFANNPDSKFMSKSKAEGKVLLVGNGRFIANKYDSMPNRTGSGFMYRPQQINDLQFDQELIKLKFPHFFGNQEFVQNMADYMLGDNSVLDIRSRQIDIHEIDREKVKRDATFYKLLNVGLPVFLIILLGFVMNSARKISYTSSQSTKEQKQRARKFGMILVIVAVTLSIINIIAFSSILIWILALVALLAGIMKVIQAKK
ncbi:MAG: Gldg family protein [Crocinitomicaceae bacterium]|nr:Gldg family protein [Crocinitomicaceae bacterium]